MLLYNHLHGMTGNLVYLLNGAVALSWHSGVRDGLGALSLIAAGLEAYQPFHAAKADMLRRDGQVDAARRSYETAIGLSQNAGERLFLERRRESLL